MQQIKIDNYPDEDPAFPRNIIDYISSEKAFLEQEEVFNTMFMHAPVGIALSDSLTGTFFMVNRQFARIVGRSMEEMTKINWMQITHPDDIQPDLDKMLLMAEGKIGSYKMEKRYIKPCGKIVWINMTIIPLKIGNKDYPRNLCMIEDITDRKKAEEELINQHIFLNSIIDCSPYAMWISDKHGTLIRMNQSCRDILHISDEEVKGRYNILKDSILEEQGFMPMIKNVFDKGEKVRFICSYDTASVKGMKLSDTVNLVLEVYISPILNVEGKVTNAVIQHIDITERKKQEEKMLSLMQAVDQSPATIVITDTKGSIQYVNRKFIDLTGYSFDEAIGSNPRILKSGEMSDEKYKQLWQTISSGNTWYGEFHNKKKDGTLYWENAIISPIINAEGSIIKLLAIKEDITERKLTEKALAQASDLLDRTSKLAKIGGWELDLQTMDLFWTPETYLIHDVEPDIKPTLEMAVSFHSAEAKPHIEAFVKNGIENGTAWDYEYPMITAKGRHIWVRGQGFPVKKDGVVVKLNGTFQDITDRLHAEKMYSDLFEMSPQPMWLFDIETYAFLRVNKAAIRHYGYSEEEFLSMTIMDIKSSEQVFETKRDIEKQKKSADKNFSTVSVHNKKSGEKIDVEVYGTTIKLNDKEVGSIISIDVTEKNRHEHEIMKAIIKTQEDERFVIGGELHDNIAQILVASKLSLSMLKNSIEPTKIQWYNQATEYITLAIEEIRNLSRRLAPVIFENKTLEDAFRKLINEMNADGKYKVLISFGDEIKKNNISQDLQLNLYRILQEQLNNILRYSMANTIEVDVHIDQNLLNLRIADNGIGFNLETDKKGIGLANMKRRAESFSGKLNVKSAPNYGCIIEIAIPLKDIKTNNNK